MWPRCVWEGDGDGGGDLVLESCSLGKVRQMTAEVSGQQGEWPCGERGGLLAGRVALGEAVWLKGGV